MKISTAKTGTQHYKKWLHFLTDFKTVYSRTSQMSSSTMCLLLHVPVVCLKFSLCQKVKTYQTYQNSCQASEHCHRPHQKNLENPSCVRWQRSQLESGRQTCFVLVVQQTRYKGTVYNKKGHFQPEIKSEFQSSHLYASSLRNRDPPGAVQVVGVRVWVTRWEDGAFAGG